MDPHRDTAAQVAVDLQRDFLYDGVSAIQAPPRWLRRSPKPYLIRCGGFRGLLSGQMQHIGSREAILFEP